MKKYFSIGIVILIVSCKTGLNSDVQYGANDDRNIYKLVLNPEDGSVYQYEISNESSVKMEVEGKKISNSNKTDATVYYTLNKDSSGDFLLGMQYKKLHIFAKNDENETNLNSENAANSIDPMEQMLGELKEAVIEATVTRSGTIKSIKGYEALGDKIIANFGLTERAAKDEAKKNWEKAIGGGVIKKNIEQLFGIFPDSAVRVGDKWKIRSIPDTELGLVINTFFTLKHLNDKEIILATDSKVTSDSGNPDLSENHLKSALNGWQQGEYQVERKTGIVLRADLNSEIEGSVQVMGKDIPIFIAYSVKIRGKRSK